MREIEARWLGERLARIPPAELSPILEIGSSGLMFRTKVKPHIEMHVHGPLRQRGIKIVTADIRSEVGVDIVGDIFERSTQDKLRSVNAKTLLLCNLFEHLQDPLLFAQICRQFISPGGWIIVTVPNDYPYHLDPIDTMLRPGPVELHDMFPGTLLEVSEILADGGHWSDLRKTRSPAGAAGQIVMDLLRALALRGGFHRARSRLSRLNFLFRRYKIAAVMLRVPSSPTPA